MYFCHSHIINLNRHIIYTHIKMNPMNTDTLGEKKTAEISFITNILTVNADFFL
jgi:hypothetical protein